MKLILISDSHGYHNSIVMPEGDVLIHSGDLSIEGRRYELDNFLNWFGKQKPKHKIFIAGNHELEVGKTKGLISKIVKDYNNLNMTDIIYLEESGVEIEGLNFWGSPYTPEFFQWQFMYSRNGEGKEIWAKISENTDVLITHGPVFGVLDSVQPCNGYPFHNAGCPALLERVKVVKPKLLVHGHIHSGYGHKHVGETLVVNASTCNEAYSPVHKPIVIDTETWEVSNEGITYDPHKTRLWNG